MTNLTQTSKTVKFPVEDAAKQHSQDLTNTAQTLLEAIRRLENMELLGATLTLDYTIASGQVSPLLFDCLMTHLRNEWSEIGDLLDAGIKEKLEFVSLRRTFSGKCRVCEGWNGAAAPLSTSEVVELYLDSRRSKGIAQRSIELYSSVLIRLAETEPELPIRPEPIEKFIAQFSCQNSTRRTYFRILKRFYRFLAKRYQISNPVELIETPKAPRKLVESLDPGELGRLLAVPLSSRDRAAILVMSGCGLRQGEARSLTPADIYADTIRVRGKTGERIVPASPSIITALLALHDNGADNAPIFWGSHVRRPLGSAGFERLTKEAFQLAGITGKRASPHILRHTFARVCIVNGMDISTLRVLMGHSSIATTEKYLCFATREIDDKYNRYAPFSHLTDRRLPSAEGRLPSPEDRLLPSDDRISLCYEGVNDYLAELAKTFARAAELISGLVETLKRDDGHHPEQLSELKRQIKQQADK